MAIPVVLPYQMPTASDLPKNRAPWKADPKRLVLLIHDMQQYFLNVYTPGKSPVVELLENIKLLKTGCTELGIPIVYTAQPGAQKPEDRTLLNDIWGPGIADEHAQTKIVDGVAPGEKDTVLTKWRYSAFKRTGLLEYMQEKGRNQLIICGIYAHIGCLLTACDAFMQDIETFLVGDALADFSLEHHKMTLAYAADNCAVTVSTALLLEELKALKYPACGKGCEAGVGGLTLQLVRKQVSEYLGEFLSDIDDNENLIDKGMDSIRLMSLVEKWRSAGVKVTMVKLAKEPTISAWWRLLSS